MFITRLPSGSINACDEAIFLGLNFTGKIIWSFLMKIANEVQNLGIIPKIISSLPFKLTFIRGNNNLVECKAADPL